MSQIISFSADKNFAEGLDGLIEKSGYQNRSKFLRDAAIHYSEVQQRGEIATMKDEEIVEGHLVIYYQHGIEHKLMEIRHSNQLEISSSVSYTHLTLPTSNLV